MWQSHILVGSACFVAVLFDDSRQHFSCDFMQEDTRNDGDESSKEQMVPIREGNCE